MSLLQRVSCQASCSSFFNLTIRVLSKQKDVNPMLSVIDMTRLPTKKKKMLDVEDAETV